MRNPAAPAILSALTGIAAAGCSPISLGSARDLAQTGQTGVAAFQTTYESGVTGNVRMNEYHAIRTQLSTRGENAAADLGPSDDRLADIRRHLNARVSVLQALNRSYGALHDLAAFGTEGDLTASLHGLRDAVSAAGATFAGPPGGLAAGAIADPLVTVGGLLVEERQKRRVARASAEIQHELRRFLSIAESDDEVAYVVNVLEPVHTARLRILRGMWDNRMVSAAPLFREFTDNSSFALIDPASPVLTNENRRLDAIVQQRFDSQLRDMRQSLLEVYVAHRTLFQNLIAEHQRLQDGEPLDPARLRGYSTDIAGLLQKVQILVANPSVRVRR